LLVLLDDVGSSGRCCLRVEAGLAQRAPLAEQTS